MIECKNITALKGQATLENWYPSFQFASYGRIRAMRPIDFPVPVIKTALKNYAEIWIVNLSFSAN